MAQSPEERKQKAAERARKWRAENRERHRAMEKDRYHRRKAVEPEKLREQGRIIAARWRANNPEKSKEVQKRAYYKNPEARRNSMFKYRYGITLEEWNNIFTQQGNACAICKMKTPRRKGWCLDHCHSSLKVRGILCHDCNTAIGYMQDNPARLRAAADYIEGGGE